LQDDLAFIDLNTYLPDTGKDGRGG
jgi:hypothetical protein